MCTYQVAIIYKAHLIAVAAVRKGADRDLVSQVGIIWVLCLSLELQACNGQEQQRGVEERGQMEEVERCGSDLIPQARSSVSASNCRHAMAARH